jgi:hypothetical protein
MKIGKAHRNNQSASIFKFFLFGLPLGNVITYELCAKDHIHRWANTIGTGWIGAPIVVAPGVSVRQYIGEPMSPSANRQCCPDTVRQ